MINGCKNIIRIALKYENPTLSARIIHGIFSIWVNMIKNHGENILIYKFWNQSRAAQEALKWS